MLQKQELGTGTYIWSSSKTANWIDGLLLLHRHKRCFFEADFNIKLPTNQLTNLVTSLLTMDMKSSYDMTNPPHKGDPSHMISFRVAFPLSARRGSFLTKPHALACGEARQALACDE